MSANDDSFPSNSFTLSFTVRDVGMETVVWAVIAMVSVIVVIHTLEYSYLSVTGNSETPYTSKVKIHL